VKPRTALVVLILLVLLYVGSLVLGIEVNRSGSASDEDPSARSWLAALGRWTAPLAPALDVRRLHCRYDAGMSRPASRPFRLTQDQPSCRVDIPRDPEEDYRNARVRLVGSAGPEADALPPVYLLAEFDGADSPRRKRNPSECLLESELSPRFRLRLLFDSHGSDKRKDPWECWLAHDPAEPIPLTVLSDGATLRLTCEGCDPQHQIQLYIQ